jgi:rhomboid protease GluP
MKLTFASPVTLAFAGICAVATLLPHAGLSGSVLSLLTPLGWIPIFTWPFSHANASHLIGNLMLFLLLGPMLEKVYGSGKFLFMLLFSFVTVGICHLGLGSGTLIGFSGTVYMCIVLASLSATDGNLSLTSILVMLLYGYMELTQALSGPSNISHLSHLAGGATGLLIGFLTRKNTASNAASSSSASNKAASMPIQSKDDLQSMLTPKAQEILNRSRSV